MIAATVLVVLGLAVLVVSMTLTVVAETARGRLAGATGLMVAASLAAAGVGVGRAVPRPWVAPAIPGLLAVAGSIWLAAASRVAATEVPVGFLSVGGRGPWGYPTCPVDWLPERDQIKLGATAVGALGPLIGRAEAARIRSTTMDLSRQADADPGFRSAGSSLGGGLSGLVGLGGPDHLYAYVPETRPGERLGLLVFLHGDLGNFKLTTWAWKPFADRERFAVVAPSYGFGFWGPGGVPRIRWAIDHALAHLPVDPNRVYLGGISDGGNGVARGGLALADRLAGLIFVSPTMPIGVVDTDGFGRAWRGRPVFVVTGGADWSVRQSTVDPAVAAMRRRGVKVEYRVIDEETHFLFFGRRERLFGDLRRWMASTTDRVRRRDDL